LTRLAEVWEKILLDAVSELPSITPEDFIVSSEE